MPTKHGLREIVSLYFHHENLDRKWWFQALTEEFDSSHKLNNLEDFSRSGNIPTFFCENESEWPLYQVQLHVASTIPGKSTKLARLAISAIPCQHQHSWTKTVSMFYCSFCQFCWPLCHQTCKICTTSQINDESAMACRHHCHCHNIVWTNFGISWISHGYHVKTKWLNPCFNRYWIS